MKRVTPMSVLRGRLNGRTQSALAEELGVSLGHLNDILCGRRASGPKVMKALGVERVVTFREITDRQPTA